MKLLILPCIFALGSAGLAQTPPDLHPAESEPTQRSEHPHSPLEKEMEGISRNIRKLGRQYNDPAQKASSMELVADLQKSAETAKTLTPSAAEKKSDEEKVKFLETYHKDIDALIAELATLKQTVENGEATAIKTELDKINQLKMSSHKELGVRTGGTHPGGPKGSPDSAAPEHSPAAQ